MRGGPIHRVRGGAKRALASPALPRHGLHLPGKRLHRACDMLGNGDRPVITRVKVHVGDEISRGNSSPLPVGGRIQARRLLRGRCDALIEASPERTTKAVTILVKTPGGRLSYAFWVKRIRPLSRSSKTAEAACKAGEAAGRRRRASTEPVGAFGTVGDDEAVAAVLDVVAVVTD